MKLFKPFLLTTLIIATSANAASKTPKASPANITTIENALSISVEDREMAIDADGQALSQFKYILANKSTKPITNIQWISVYTHNRQVIYSQDMQLELENPLQPNQSVTLNLQIPFVKIEEKYRPIFMNKQEKIDVYKIDRVIQFNDKKILSDY